jgi:hypothetical protein
MIQARVMHLMLALVTLSVNAADKQIKSKWIRTASIMLLCGLHAPGSWMGTHFIIELILISLGSFICASR